jgi:hypothetical protein
MNPPVTYLDIAAWNRAIPGDVSAHHVAALEDGNVLYCPNLRFALEEPELRFLDPQILGDSAKSLAFDPATGVLKHARSDQQQIAAMMRRYAEEARTLICSIIPGYAPELQIGRTSFRPVGIEGRASSLAKDDTLLHVDAFPASPVADRRILRVFSNVNRDGKPRHWRLGEPFAEVAKRFYPEVRKQFPGSARLMEAIGLTRGYRTEYDSSMLAIHDAMKRASNYQCSVPHVDFLFPPDSTWIVFTDAVSHAALSGQHLFEQTFYLPVSAMRDSHKAPLRILERLAGRSLVRGEYPQTGG